MDYQIVVARFNEDVSWLLPEKEHVILYNKGSELHLPEMKIESLPNIGREAHTYLHYIITNYDSLPETIIFTQAKLSDHKFYSRHISDLDYLHVLRLQSSESKILKSDPFIKYTIGSGRSCWEPNWNCIGLDKDNQFLQPDKFFLHNNYFNNTPIVFQTWFQTNIQSEYPNPIYVYPGAIFAVQRERILRHPKEYYEGLLKFLEHHNEPAEAHFFERSWYYIF